jgi:prepilin peptidase CpaA
LEYAPPAAKAILVLLQLLIIGAALQDAWRLRISNLFPLAIIACFAGWVAVIGPEIDLWQNLVAFLLCLGLGLFLFSRNWLGGGDVKLLAALALWFDLAGAGRLLIFTMMGGGLVTLLLIFCRALLPSPADKGPAAMRRRGPIPYGLAIAVGALLAIHLDTVNPAPLSPFQKMQAMPLPK